MCCWCVRSFSIDDGSSSAFVSCTGQQVAILLDLSADQWTELEGLLQPLGHVIYELVCVLGVRVRTSGWSFST